MEVKLLGPVQLYVAPETPELAVSMTLPVQEMNPPDAERSGAVISCVTAAVAVEVIPFNGFVTVNVYVPAVLTVGF